MNKLILRGWLNIFCVAKGLCRRPNLPRIKESVLHGASQEMFVYSEKRNINKGSKRWVENQLSRGEQWVWERSRVHHASLLRLTLLNIWSGDLRAKTEVHAWWHLWMMQNCKVLTILKWATSLPGNGLDELGDSSDGNRSEYNCTSHASQS